MAGQLNPLPVRDRLPGVLLTDEVVQQFCSALDDVLTPVVLTLDCLPAYLDPDTTPQDVVAWLAEWMGVVLDSRQSIAAATPAAAAHRATAALARHGARDPRSGRVRDRRRAGDRRDRRGGVVGHPGTALPGSAGNEVTGAGRAIDDPSRGTLRRIEQAVAAVTPAHIRYAVEVVGAGG